jgi:hypothetical protein
MRQRGYNKMSLCYDFQKWTIISLAAVAISLTIGLVTLAYGEGQGFQYCHQHFSNGTQLCHNLQMNMSGMNMSNMSVK